MKKAANKRKTTTVSCDKSTREFIAAEAKRTGKLQREVLAEMVKTYRESQERSATKEQEEAQELKTANEYMAAINEKLDKAIKRDDGVKGFIKEHEKMFSSPMFDKVRNCETLLNSLIKILQNLE